MGPAKVLAASAVVLLASSCTAASVPNVLFVLADDLGYNDVGFHGSEIKTPFLDSLNHAGVELRNYYGHMICTPSRSSIMSGRYAFHTGMQHSFWGTGQDGGLPLRFKTMADHLKALGYSTAAIGKWHLGFESMDYTPLGRGFDTYYGYLGGGEDYFSHKSGKYVDLHETVGGKLTSVFNANGSYSATLFANKTIEVVQDHAAAGAPSPLFIYLAFQSIHSPIQAPEEWVTPYAWITDKSRRTMAGMASCMDAEIERIVGAFKAASLWESTLFVFAADNGGPPYVANSNYPMRGGKWTIWEGGTHLTAFAHGLGLPAKTFTGLMHHADWVATIVEGAAGGKLLPDGSPPPDSLNMWPTLMDKSAVSGGPRKDVVMNIDPTNQGQVANDPGGWSGYAAIRVGDMKLVLGWPGVPDSWCWPNQNDTDTAAQGYRNASTLLSESITSMAVPCTRAAGEDGLTNVDENGRCPLDLATAHDVEGAVAAGAAAATAERQLEPAPECAPPPGAESASCCFRGHQNPDLRHFQADNASACCAPCGADPECVGYTFNTAGGGNCWLKKAVGQCSPASECTSAVVPGRHKPTPTPSPPAAYPGPLTCGYTGKVPPPELRTKPMLFNLKADVGERHDLAAAQPGVVEQLKAKLQVYIDSAVPPLNEFSCKVKKGPGCRGVDPLASAAAAEADAWVPWK